MKDSAGTYTVGRLGELCGVSRSTLLYYDSLGLLAPSGRSPSGYRLYSEADRARLERILAFRINEEIAGLRGQQRGILDLLEADGSLKVGRAALLALSDLGKAAGISETNYEALHAAFEANAPAEHRRLLGLLGFTESETGHFLESLSEAKKSE